MVFDIFFFEFGSIKRRSLRPSFLAEYVFVRFPWRSRSTSDSFREFHSTMGPHEKKWPRASLSEGSSTIDSPSPVGRRGLRGQRSSRSSRARSAPVFAPAASSSCGSGRWRLCCAAVGLLRQNAGHVLLAQGRMRYGRWEWKCCTWYSRSGRLVVRWTRIHQKASRRLVHGPDHR